MFLCKQIHGQIWISYTLKYVYICRHYQIKVFIHLLLKLKFSVQRTGVRSSSNIMGGGGLFFFSFALWPLDIFIFYVVALGLTNKVGHLNYRMYIWSLSIQSYVCVSMSVWTQIHEIKIMEASSSYADLTILLKLNMFFPQMANAALIASWNLD